MNRDQLLDLYFVDARAKLVDIAALLDRVERSGEPHGTIDLTVEARGNANAETWRGRYVLSIGETVNGEFRTRRLTGRVSCSVEG